MELSDVKILINKYFDGEASLDEERALGDYLATCNDLDDELLAAKMMFEAFGKSRTCQAPANIQISKPTMRSANALSLRRFAAVAVAACVVAFVALSAYRYWDVVDENLLDESLVCYVDGVMVNGAEARAESERIVGSVFSSVDAALGCVSRITHRVSE